MAKFDLKNSMCIPGSLFVDTNCIDCGTCFHIAPSLFVEKNNLSFNSKQPESIEEWTLTKEAVLSCPTNSIGVIDPPDDFKNAPNVLPKLITDNIYFCGYNAEASYGATSYFIQHAEGNILIDSPRYNAQLAQKIEELGGIKYMFLTHKDDVADHQKFADHFNCQRIIHADDLSEDTRHCEIILHSATDVSLLSDVKVIMTPGHTKGHMVLLFKNRYLFSGDHLFYDHNSHELYASKNVNWYSWEQQIQSLKKLTLFDFDWILPGHGGWTQMDPAEIKSSLNQMH